MKIIIFKPTAFFALLAMTGLFPSIAFTLWSIFATGSTLGGIGIGILGFVVCFIFSGWRNHSGYYWRIHGASGNNLLFFFLITFMLLGAGGILISTTIARFFYPPYPLGVILEFIGGCVILTGTIFYWRRRFKKDWEIQKR